ncbi:ABC transporter substrate-binding protein [Peptoniphilus catoniae]|uniref:ABC transporter substrate-binding protein n=1 Tax=Peptoniphilus catoniae TaxID=1660341 RepID=UPI0010FCECF3|nr:ABC transporter substrate-binding protein [Peptoniphilus catoniae]
MRKILITIMSLVFVLTACGGNNTANTSNGGSEPQDSDVIKLGGIIPKTGAVAVYGNTTENGIKLAIEEINANGGINGKQIEYSSEDDKGDPTEAVTIYNKLVEGGAQAIIGPITSKPAQAVADNSDTDGIPMITPTGTMSSITEGKDNVFRTCFTDPLQGAILANFAADSLQAKKVAIMRNTSDDYSNGVADAFKEQAEKKGMEVVADEGYGQTDVDFRVQLTNIQKASPDVILIPEYYEKDVLMAKQIKDLGIDAKIIGPDGWDGVLATVDPGSESILEGVYFTNHYAVDDESEKVKNFVNAYKEKYNETPSAFAALGYDTIYLYKAAFEKAESTDYEAVIEALKNIDVDGVTGNIKFGENNNPVKPATIIKIDQGEYVFDSIVSPE